MSSAGSRYKYHEIKRVLASAIKDADYFYFMDADTGFNEDTGIIDIGADLAVVEHPMYPRDHMGWCDKASGQAMCGTCYEYFLLTVTCPPFRAFKQHCNMLHLRRH